jgi:hypothetical protein
MVALASHGGAVFQQQSAEVQFSVTQTEWGAIDAGSLDS